MIAERIFDLFRGRPDTLAVATASGFEPEQTAPTAARIESEHLSGNRCLGFYLLNDRSECFCSAVDFDNKPERPDPAWQDKAERVYFLLQNLELSPLVEISQSGTAAHVWLFFGEPIAAGVVRAFWRVVLGRLGINAPEIYPRQDRLKADGLGNLIRYPLWGQSRFVEIESEWEAIDPLAALATIRPVSEATLRTVAWEMGCSELRSQTASSDSDDEGGLSHRVRKRLENPSSLLSRRWFGDTSGLHDASRSALVQSIACELVRTYVPTPEIERAIRHWCDRFGYEKGQRDGWVRDTVRKAYDFVLTRIEAKSVDVKTLYDLEMSYLDKLELGKQVLLPSGIPELDSSIEGVAFGEMVVIAALPSHGKSAMGMQWLDAAASGGAKCLMLSEEMSLDMVAKRGIQYASEIEEPDWRSCIAQVRSELQRHQASRGIYVVESCGTIDRAEELIDQYCGLHGVSVVAVDYLGLLGSRKDSRYEVVTDVSRRLKLAAKRNNCVLLALCQLNRKINDRPLSDGAIPRNSDLRESGQIEQDADVIIFLQWPLMMDPRYEDPDEFRIYITKRRNGRIRERCLRTTFNGARQRISFAEKIEQTTDTFAWKGK